MNCKNNQRKIAIQRFFSKGEHRIKEIMYLKQITFFTICSGKPRFATAAVSVNMVVADSTVQTRITGALINICQKEIMFSLTAVPHGLIRPSKYIFHEHRKVVDKMGIFLI